MRNVLDHVAVTGAGWRLHRHLIRPDDAKAARDQWRRVADQLRANVPILAALMDQAERTCWYMTFPARSGEAAQHQPAGTPQRGDRSEGRTVVGIFPNGRHHSTGRRPPARTERRMGCYMTGKAMAEMTEPAAMPLPAMASWRTATKPSQPLTIRPNSYTTAGDTIIAYVNHRSSSRPLRTNALAESSLAWMQAIAERKPPHPPLVGRFLGATPVRSAPLVCFCGSVLQSTLLVTLLFRDPRSLGTASRSQPSR